MKKKLLSVILILTCFLLSGCSMNLKGYIMIQDVINLMSSCYITYNGKTNFLHLNWDGINRSVSNCFFINNNLICISTDKDILYYRIDKKEFIRKLPFLDLRDYRANTISTKINNMGDIIIVSNGIIYKYIFNTEELINLYEGFDCNFDFKNEKIRLFDHGSIVYSEKRNSILLTTVNWDTSNPKKHIRIAKIREFSLNDFSLKDITFGAKPCLTNNDSMLYISSDEKEIREFNLNTLQDVQIILKSDEPISSYMTNIKLDKIVFLTRKANYTRFDSHIWDKKNNKIKNFSDDYKSYISDIIFPEDNVNYLK